MLEMLEAIANRLASAYHRGASLAFCFDYDGTLVPIVQHPTLARLDLDTRRLLENLASRPRLQVGIISGRCLADLQRIVDMPGIFFAGTSGLELDLLDQRVIHPGADSFQKLVAEVVQGMTEVVCRTPGAWVEDKGLALTMHYRNVPVHHLHDLLERARRLLRRYTNELHVVDGPMAWEMTPLVDWNKGTALRRILESGGSCPIPIYAGDSENDKAALRVATALGGISIGIGERSLPADHRLRNPGELFVFLTALAEALNEPPSPRAAGPIPRSKDG